MTSLTGQNRTIAIEWGDELGISLKRDPGDGVVTGSNFILMHAMGANTAGQLGSVIAGGILLALLGAG
jgi:hypothetical protein